MNNENQLEQIDIKKLLEVVLDKIVYVISITIVFAILSFCLSKYFIAPKYKSEITMIVDNRKSTTMTDDTTETKTLSSDINASQLLVPTYIEMVRSNNVLESVADNLTETTGKKYNVKKLKSMIEAESVLNTEILKVSVKSTDAVEAREIAETIAGVAPDKIQKFIERSDVKIIDHAKISTTPVSPNLRNNTIIGLLLGFVLSIAVILIKELLDVRVKSIDDLVQLFNYPVLGTIPEIYVSYDETAIDNGKE